MGEIPEKQVYQELLEKDDPKLNAIGKEIQDIVNDSKKEHNDKIDFSSNFEIKSDDAKKIIEYIDNLLNSETRKDNEDLKMLKTHLRGSAHPDYTMPNPDSSFSDIKRINVDKELKKQIKEISNDIKSILKFLEKNKITDQNTLKTTLTEVKNILKDRNNITHREMAQIAGLIGLDPNYDAETLFNGLSKFIESTRANMTMTEEFNQSKNVFNSFYKACINGRYSELYKFSSNKNVNKIKFFIEYNPGNGDIQDLYLKMKEINAKGFNNVGNNGEIFHSQDKIAFNKVFDILKEQYENGDEYTEQVQRRFLDKHFPERLSGKSLSDFCKTVLGMTGWEGEMLKEDDKYDGALEDYCKTWVDFFTVEQLKDKIDEKNKVRKEKNKQVLKNRIKIKDIVGEDLLSKLSIKEEENGNKKILYTQEEPKELTSENFLRELKLDSKIKTKAVGIKFLGDELNETVKELQGDWYKEVISHIESINEKEKDGDKSAEKEIQPEFESLDNITLPEKFLFNGITLENITEAISKAKSKLSDYKEESDKAEYAARIKSVISAIKEPGEKGKNGGWGKIETLQNTMNNKLNPSKPLSQDGKLGKYTFNAIKDYLGITTRGEILINKGGLTAEQRKIAELIDKPEQEDNLRKLLRVNNDVDVNEAALDLLKRDKSREYLSWYIDDKNFPGKKTVTELLNATGEDKKTKLKALQLQLVPYYKGKIDGLIGPMTLTAIEEYFNDGHKKDSDSENNKSIAKKNENIKRYNSNGSEINEGININCIVDKENNDNHAYFIDGVDFEYVKNTSERIILANILGYNYTYNIGGGTLSVQKGEQPESINDERISNYFSVINNIEQ